MHPRQRGLRRAPPTPTTSGPTTRRTTRRRARRTPSTRSASPAKWGQITVTPTGEDNRARVIGIAPASRGAVARRDPRRRRRRVTAVPAGARSTRSSRHRATRRYAVRMRMCNEKAAEVGCSISDPKAVQTYGPLTAASTRSPAVNGVNVTWVFSGTSNGDAAILGVSVEGGAPQVFPRAPGSLLGSPDGRRRDYSTATTSGPPLRRQPRRPGRVRGEGQAGPARHRHPASHKGAACTDGTATRHDCKRRLLRRLPPTRGPMCGLDFIHGDRWAGDFSCASPSTRGILAPRREDIARRRDGRRPDRLVLRHPGGRHVSDAPVTTAYKSLPTSLAITSTTPPNDQGAP